MDNLQQKSMEQLVRTSMKEWDSDTSAPIDSSTNKEILKEIISRDEFRQYEKSQLRLAILANLPTVPKEEDAEFLRKMVEFARDVLGDINVMRNDFIAFDLSKTAKIFHLTVQFLHDSETLEIAKETFFAIYIRSHFELSQMKDIYLLIRHLVPDEDTEYFYDNAQKFLEEIINF